MLCRQCIRSLTLLMIILCSVVWGSMGLEATDWEVGKVYHGFQLVQKKQITEINALGLVFKHQKSGAQLLKLITNEDDNMFCVGFRTNPFNDAGVAHIMEHSVLNGSKKYPVKSPFDVLKQGSLHTFLNALTSKDMTMYPASSRNDKDFYNMMDIYLDAVYSPRIYDEPMIFKREGWHYSLESKDAELGINGIVYNEMKGNYSSPLGYVIYYMNKYLYPDNIYGLDSGGNPDAIPTLTYQQFLDFHKTYYHPSNSYIFLQGDHDPLIELKYIDENYLSKFQAMNIDSSVPMQKPFDKMKEMVAEYPLAMDGEEKDNTWLLMSFMAGRSQDRDVTMALDILSEVLIDRAASPLRRALSDAGIGQAILGSFSESLQNSFTIAAKNANETDTAKFKTIIFDTLNKLVKEGIDKQMLEGALNQKEFDLRENSGGGYPPALNNFYNAMDGWFFSNDPFVGLAFEQSLATLKKGLKTDYYEKIVEKYLLNNPHSLLLTIKPKKGMNEEKISQLKKELADYKASLTDAQLEELVQQTAALKKYQSEPDSPEALKVIPMLSLQDIDPKAERLDVQVRQEGDVKVLAFPVFANNIIYLRLMFDAKVVPQELIPYVRLLSYLLGQIDTKNYSYGDLDNQIAIHTGNLDFSVYTYMKDSAPDQPLPKLEVDAKVLPGKTTKLMELIGEIISNSQFTDDKRLKELITQYASRMQMFLRQAGLELARSRFISYLSPYGQCQELFQGLSYAHFITNIARNYDTQAEEIKANLQKVFSLLFNKDQKLVGITCSDTDYPKFKENLPILLKSLGKETPKPVTYSFNLQPENEGLQAASRVQYVVKGYDFKQLGYKYSGKYRVLAQILNRDYLQRKIRIIGGAYGRGASFPRFGISYVYSYRDPQLEKTLEAFDQAAEYIKNFEADPRDFTRFILGTINGTEPQRSPEEKGTTAFTNYIEGITYQDLQNERDEILSVTLDDIRNMSKMVADIMGKNCYCVYGNDAKLEESKQLFKKLIKVE